MSNENQDKEQPSYWGLLSSYDQEGYVKLKEEIDPLTYRATKDKLKNQFQIILDTIKHYVFQHDGNDSLRSLVCGIIWISDGIAVCNRNLSKLIGKCKSSINSGLQALGYINSSITPKHGTELAKLFPFMKGNCAEMRQWTSRINPAEASNCQALFASYFDIRIPQQTEEQYHETDYFFQTDSLDLQSDDGFPNFGFDLNFLDVY
ncbi:hypothetical protein GPJ56_001733 [Histomonas meleagridis]|uniref:uncharacterized protein n=1 Tax=Histomonas meleagridis TaxID=135588 RepID=UPI00355A87FF|nr:hypothetical protein GPJ56_001733 [Histomonas meleagridis]KAH0796182.1 hypothetical protein GO595_010075 [Histomonas meleagridis]